MIDNMMARISGNEFAVFLLIIVLMLAFAEIGFRSSYGAGAEGARSKLGSVFLPLLITVVIVLSSISPTRAWA